LKTTNNDQQFNKIQTVIANLVCLFVGHCYDRF